MLNKRIKFLGLLILAVSLTITMASCDMGETVESYDLTIEVDGEGDTEPGPDTHEYDEGTTVELEAIPDEGWEFDSWEGNVQNSDAAETTILMESNETVTAVFEEEEIESEEYELTINIEGEGSTIPEEGTHEYIEGTTVNIEAIPDDNCKFDQWTGDVDSTDKEISVYMDGNKTITAHFGTADKIRSVDNATELYDAIDNQDDYDGIKFTANIDSDVNYDVELTSDNLVLNLNGNKLMLDKDKDFKVAGDDISVEGGVIEVQGIGEIFIGGYGTIMSGVDITTDDEDFIVDTGGDVKLTIDNSEFDLGDGDFEVYADYEGAELKLEIDDFAIKADDFEIDADEDNQIAIVNIFDSEFNLDGDFDFEADGDNTVVDLEIDNSKFDVGWLEIDADGKNSDITVKIMDSKIFTDGRYNWGFDIDTSTDGGNVSYIEIANTEFDVRSFWIDVKFSDHIVLLEDLTFSGVNRIRLQGDAEITDLIIKEEAADFSFDGGITPETYTYTLHGVFELENENNKMKIGEWGGSNTEIKIKGDAEIKGDGKIIFYDEGHDVKVAGLTFDVDVDIEDKLTFDGVSMADNNTVRLKDALFIGSDDLALAGSNSLLDLNSGDASISGGGNTIEGDGIVKISENDFIENVEFNVKIELDSDVAFDGVTTQEVDISYNNDSRTITLSEETNGVAWYLDDTSIDIPEGKTLNLEGEGTVDGTEDAKFIVNGSLNIVDNVSVKVDKEVAQKKWRYLYQGDHRRDAYTAIGGIFEDDWKTAIIFEPEGQDEYITKVAYYDYEGGSTITPKICKDDTGEPSDSLWTGAEYDSEGDGWLEIEVDPKVEIEKGEFYWILFKVEGQNNERYPMGVDEGPPEDNADRVYFTSVDGWERLTDSDLNYNWLMEVQVEHTTD